ncbi:MAG: GntP family permease [Polyangiaceae bacterium]|nr:GntP family permease [Polyangiaceae bacterium]
MTWTPHDSALFAIAAGATLGLVVLVTLLRVHPFVALAVASIGLGLGAGLSPEGAAASFQKGFGETLGSVGAVLGLGAILGRLMAESGAADRIVAAVVERAPARALPWAIAAAALVVGIPTFFEIGVVLMMPVVVAASRRSGLSLLRLGIPALAALSVLHALLPPHPAPLLCAGALHADLGATMGAGLAIAVPTVALAGPVFGGFIGRRIRPRASETPFATRGADTGARAGRSSVTVAWAAIALPIGLMLARTAVTVARAQGPAAALAISMGHPLVAMLASVVVAAAAFARARGMGARQVAARLGEGLGPIGAVVMIIGAGGGFKQTLVESGVAGAIADAAHSSSLSPLVLAWLVAATIRVATGSATVATVTASGILAPILPSLGHASPVLVTLAVGGGSVFFSHVNDAGFWLVKEAFGMSVGETLASWSVMETIVSVVVLGCVMAMASIGSLG